VNIFDAMYNYFQRRRQVLVFFLYSALMVGAFGSSLLLFFNFSIPPDMQWLAWKTAGVFLLVKLVVFYSLGMHLGMWRYTTVYDLLKITIASTIATVVLAALYYFRHNIVLFKTVYVLDWMISIFLLGGIRVGVRLLREWRAVSLKAKLKETIIVGAGDAAVMLLKEIRNNPSMEYEIVGFVDDDPHKKKLKIMGCPVLGKIDDLSDLIVEHNVAEVIIAMPTAGKGEIQRIVALCKAAGVEPKTLPSMTDIVERRLFSQIHKVKPEDMLFRESVTLHQDTLTKLIKGNCIMVTGAAGSIGSELVMQAAKCAPSLIVMYDMNENNLFLVEERLRDYFPDVKYVSHVGSILNRKKLKDVIETNKPRLVYHAAAYKHVPMMEKDPIEAVQNNIVGTKNVAEIADGCGVEKMVLISTDKAVHPANVMGASKRVCELVLKSMSAGSKTAFIIVRFGNVLGSNGSVIPLFQAQIEAGGPVKVTHPDIERFFMTISEAVQLVLESSSIGKNGDLFVLDMGKPVKILEVAQSMIKMSGAENMRIEFTGLRPGEKLHEELWYGDEEAEPTVNNKIFHVKKGSRALSGIEGHLRDLEALSSDRKVAEIVRKLKEIVPEFVSPASPPS